MVDIASLAIQINTSDVSRAGQELDKLAGAGKKVEQAASGIAAATKADLGSAATTWKQFISERLRDYQKLEGSHGAAMKRMGTEWQEYKKTLSAPSPALPQLAPLLDENSDAMKRAGLSAGQYQQAIRMLPMQLTDVVTSLASGMPLWMVAIQQGGQVRDAFGGIGNAARAVAAELGPLRLAFGGVATAAGVLALAYYKGSEEQDRFNESLILTGNYAGATAEGLGAMARQVGDAAGTTGAAAEVLAQLAGTGKITSDRFEEIAVAALKMEQATGKAAAETVAEFAKIADDPVKAVVQLNEKYHFLTASVYEQIRALQEQGDTLGAASLAEQTLAEAQTERANKIIENLGSVETAWEGVKKVAKEAWDAVLDIGREDTLDQKLTKLQERLSTIQQARINPLVLGDNPDMIALSGGEAGVAAEWASALQGEVDAQAKAHREMFDALNISAGTKAYEGIQKNLDATASKSEKLTKALEENRRQIDLARRAGYAITAEQEAALERQTREQFKETAKRPRAFTDNAATRMLQQLRNQEATLQAQLAGNDKLTAAQRAQVEWAQQLADLKNKSILTAEQKSLLANQGAITAQLAENAALEDQLRKREQLTELERIRISILRDSGQTEAANAAQFELDFAQRRLEYERQGNTEAIKRLDTLRQIQEANSRASLPTGTIEGVSQAPSADGISPSVGGASAEMIRLEQDRMALENWRLMELEKQTAFLEAKAINEEVYAERVRNINEQSAENLGSISSAMFSAQLGAAEDLVGNIAGLAAQAAGEQSGLYKVMFAAQKAFAIAQTIVNAEMASAAALAPPPIGLGPIAGLPYSQVIRGMGYASAAVIGAQALAGMAHDGIDSVPREGTWLLDKGERVVDSRTNQDLKQYLSGQQQGAGGMNVVVNNYSNSRVETRQNKNGELEVIIRAVEDRLVGGIAAGDSRLGTVMERSYGMQRQGR